MAMNPQDMQNFRNNWDQMRSQVQAQFPALTAEDLDKGASNPEQLAQRICALTGQSEAEVNQQLTAMSNQLSGQTQSDQGQSGQSQRQNA